MLDMCKSKGLRTVRVRTMNWEVEGTFGEPRIGDTVVGKPITLGTGLPDNLDLNDSEAVEAYLEIAKKNGMSAEDFE